MLTLKNTEVMNFEAAIRGMRNPLNSWDKSDSEYCVDRASCKGCKYLSDAHCQYSNCSIPYVIGGNDLALAQKLIKAGSDHRKFMRQIFVSVDITAPLYWWKEFDTYKVGTVANSCSTMHTIHKKEFTLSDFSWEQLLEPGLQLLEATIDFLNTNRARFLETGNKLYWYQMIQSLSTSYNQTRTVTLNYENLRNIYNSRRNHKLDEWRVYFIRWIESLPYAEELIKYQNGD